MEAQSPFDRLNERQRKLRASAAWGLRPLLIIAGAGTLQDQHAGASGGASGAQAPGRSHPSAHLHPSRIEMTRRTQPSSAIGTDVASLSGTFTRSRTGCCAGMRRRWASTPDSACFDRGDAADLMDVVRHELGLSNAKRFPRKDTCGVYSSREHATAACTRSNPCSRGAGGKRSDALYRCTSES
jgi:DNA helicase-2/ATP-dependent DNA helicase PcrA